MKKIRISEAVPDRYGLEARLHYQRDGCQRVRAPRIYRMRGEEEGEPMREYLLVRFETGCREAVSTLMLVTEKENHSIALSEVCREKRKNEQMMLRAWYEREGVQDVY